MSAIEWPVKEVTSFRDFMAEVASLDAHWPNRARGLFRGQSDASWSLMPTLARLLKGQPPTNAIQLEDELLHSFRNEAGSVIDTHYIPNLEQDLFGWWPLLRHYGAPTRILDWSLSAYVAAYFAVIEDWDKPGAVWFVRSQDHNGGFSETEVDLLKKYRNLILRYELLRDPTAPNSVTFFEVTRQPDRVSAQQGWFSVCMQPAADHAASIMQNAANRGNADHLRKIVIGAKCKPEFLRELQMMNITAKSLFPGVDGLGRSMHEIARLSIKFGRPKPVSDGGIEEER